MSDRPRRRDAAWTAAVLGVVLLAGSLRFVGLGDIDRKYFDEKYYVTQAQERLEGLEPEDRPAHPPLGTWMIAGGIAIAGDDPVGWRLAPAVAGMASVLLALSLAVYVFGTRVAGLLAATFVAVDGLAVVTSRMGILDGLQVPFALAAVLCALRWHHTRARPWLLVVGLSAGAMTAIKWNGVLLLAGLVAWVAAAAFLDSRRRSAPGTGAAVRRSVAAVVLVCGVAGGVYVASYGSWFVDYPDTETAVDRCRDLDECGTSAVDRVRGWWWEQWERADFHRRLEATHPDRSPAIRWPLLADPVTVFLERCPDGPTDGCPLPPGETRRVLATGNPALWWPGLLSLPVLAVLAWRRRRVDLAAVVLAPLALWLPWLAAPKPGFLYFLTPVVPFLAVALAGTLRSIGPRRPRRAATVLVLAAVLAVALWHAPFAFGWPLDAAGVASRNLFPSWPGP